MLPDDQLSSNFIIWFILLILNHILKIKIMSLIRTMLFETSIRAIEESSYNSQNYQWGSVIR